MKRLLFIEDDFALLKAYSAKLQLEGFEVTSSANGESALSLLQTFHPDAIILDIMLQGKMNGFDILEIIKREERLKNIPVVILTNLDSEDKTAKEIGAVNYFIKTKTDPSQVADYLKSLLSI